MPGKMVDLGKKAENAAVFASQEGESAQHLNYPEVHIENDQIPLSQEHLNKHVKATIHAHVKGIEHGTDHKGKPYKRVHLAIKAMHVHPGMESEDGEEYAEHPHKESHEKHARIEGIKKDFMKEEE